MGVEGLVGRGKGDVGVVSCEEGGCGGEEGGEEGGEVEGAGREGEGVEGVDHEEGSCVLMEG